MKPKIRVRRNVSPAKVRTQTKKEPENPPQKLRSAKLFLAAFYKQRSQMNRKSAFNDLLGMYHVAKSNPGLKEAACFLNMLLEGENSLNEMFGARELPQNYLLRMAGMWLCDYYQRLNTLSYADAMYECQGLTQLMRYNKKFQDVFNALVSINLGHRLMLEFCTETASVNTK